MKYLIQLWKSYRGFFLYVIFGVLTTLVNITTYLLCEKLFFLPTVPATVFAWIAAVLFAYLTNRKWVFCSKRQSASGVLQEMTAFFCCRLATGVLEVVLMYVTVDRLGQNGVLMKTASNVLVIVLNYIAGKFIVFQKKSD